MRNAIAGPLIAIFLALLTACQEEADDILPLMNENMARGKQVAYDSCETMIENFFVNKNLLVGSVNATNDHEKLYITFNTEGNWRMDETALYAGMLKTMPASGQDYPHKTRYATSLHSYTYVIPLTTAASDECIIISAFARISKKNEKSEPAERNIAWTDGNPIQNSDGQGSYFYYCPCQISSQKTSDF